MSSRATDEFFWRLLLAALVVIIVSRAVGALFRRINQPQVVGEIAAGILLGPSVLGALFPEATSYLFAPKVLPFLNVLAEVGLTLDDAAGEPSAADEAVEALTG